MTFYRRGEKGSRVNITTRDGSAWSGERQVTHDSAAAWFPRWSPDGRTIAYIDRRDRHQSLALVGLPDGTMRTVVGGQELGGQVAFAAWGRTADVIYVHSRGSAAGLSSESAFWSVPLSGGRPRLLLRLDAPGRRTRRQEFATDGRRLFFTVAGDESDIYVKEIAR